MKFIKSNYLPIILLFLAGIGVGLSTKFDNWHDVTLYFSSAIIGGMIGFLVTKNWPDKKKEAKE